MKRELSVESVLLGLAGFFAAGAAWHIVRADALSALGFGIMALSTVGMAGYVHILRVEAQEPE